MAKQHYVIVIADDDPAINDLLRDILSEEGYQVHCCFTREEAARVIQRIVPDVAVIDMQMEARDAGLVLLQSLRDSPQTMRLSVIICSADEICLQQNSDQITQLGAQILPKPFDVEHLLDTVKLLLAAAPD